MIDRRTFLARAALTSAATAVPAVALAARQPNPADLDGTAVMHLDGRRLLVNLHRMPEPGDEVVALVPIPTEATRKIAVFRAADFQAPGDWPTKRRAYWHQTAPHDRMTVCETIGVVVGQGDGAA